jgi:hypothetical protein
MPIFFHLFESIINNVNHLVEKYSANLLSQCPTEVKNDILKFEKENKLTLKINEEIKPQANSKQSEKKVSQNGKDQIDQKQKD